LRDSPRGPLFERRESFHLHAQLFLDAEIRPPLPVGQLPQLLHFRRERGLDFFQPLRDVVMLALRRQRRQIGERRSHVAQRALACLQRQVGSGGERRGTGGKLGQPGKRFLPDARLTRLRFGALRLLLALLRSLFFLTPALLFQLFVQAFPIARLFLFALTRGLGFAFGAFGAGARHVGFEPLGFLLLCLTPRDFLSVELPRERLSRQFGRFGDRGDNVRSRQCRRFGRRALVHLAENGAGTLERAPVFRARGNLLEIATVVEPFDGSDCGVLEVAVQRHVEDLSADDLTAFGERRERRQPDRLERGVPGDGSERMHVADAAQGAQGDLLAERRLRYGGQHSDVRKDLDRCEALGFGEALERIERDIPQHRQRRLPDALIGVRARHGRQHGRIHQLGNRRPSHPGLRVLAGDLREQIALIDRDLLDVGQPHGGIGVLLRRLRAESIQQGHIAGQA
jgi:hypothetical protein